ncbi:MAG: tetratricopeptide repeat protein [Rhodospirillaceae bacterium]|nr:tetratricopeptide repeat protein [Rhodospirillaceae bacterium]
MSRASALVKLLRAAGIAVLALGASVYATAALADGVRAAQRDQYGRIVFDWNDPVRYSAAVVNGQLIVQFERPISGDLNSVQQQLGPYVTSGFLSADGRTATFPLRPDVTMRTFTVGNAVVIDLQQGAQNVAAAQQPQAKPAGQQQTQAAAQPAQSGARQTTAPAPTAQSGAQTAAQQRPPQAVVPRSSVQTDFEPRNRPPASAAAPAQAAAQQPVAPTPRAQLATLPPVNIRTGTHPDYFRVVFEWSQRPTFKINKTGDRAEIVFDAAAPIDEAKLRSVLPEANKNASVTVENGKSIVSIPLAAGSEVRNFTNANAVVIDIVGKPEPQQRQPSQSAVAAAEQAMETRQASSSSLLPTQPAKAVPGAATQAQTQKPTAPPPPRDANRKPSDAVRAMAGDITEKAEEDEQGRRLTRTASEDKRNVDPLSARPAEISLTIGFDEPAAAAVFRRADYLWVVFDRYKQVDVSALAKAGAPYITLVEQLPYRTNTILRMVTQPDINPSMRRDGLNWTLDFRSLPMRPTRAIDVQPQLDRPEPNLFLPVTEAGRTVAFDDPEVGDYFIVIPVIPLGYGVFPERSFPDVDLPVTAQGVVVIPKSDGVRALANRNGVDIDVDGGMALSKAAAASTGTMVQKQDMNRILNLSEWQIGKGEDYMLNKQALQIAVAEEAPATKQEARLRFARFEFINGFYAEALGILRVMASTDAEVENTGPYRALRGATNLMMRRYQEASDDLNHFTLANEEDARFWLAAARSKVAAPESQAQTLIQTGATIRAYPHTVKTQLALMGTEAAIASGDDFGAQGFLDMIRRDNPNPTEKAAIDYLDGKLNQKIGELRVALEQYSKAENSPSLLYQVLGMRDRMELEYQLGTLPIDDLIENYEKLRYRWRGDDIELGFLLRLSELYAQKKDYGSALRTLKLATSYFRDFAGVDKAGDKMTAMFEELYLGGAADKLTPVQAIGLFDEFRALLPAGEKGDEMIRKLADRLVSIDLLDQAAILLQRQVEFRVVGIERARIGARLALVQLLNRKPKEALDTLRETAVPDAPSDLQSQRRRLEARALTDLDRAEDAVMLLGADTTAETKQLRAEIYWRIQDWPNAAKAIADLVPEPGAGSLSDANARLVLDWATALTLAGDERTISRLRSRYLAAMQQTPYKDPFDLMTTPREGGMMDPAAVRRQIEQAKNFKSFIVEYKDMIGDKPLSAIN